MDRKDELILQTLARDAKLSSREVAKKVGLPISTVHRRIIKLEHDGVIKGYRAVIDYEKTERPVGAFFFINIEETIQGRHIPKSKIIDALGKLSEVYEIVDVQGVNFDVIIRARFRSIKELSSFAEVLRTIEGIEESFSSIIVDEIM